jgi:hypothetical protein
MNQHTFTLIAAVIFLLIALGHLLRIVLGVTFVVHGASVPMWASGLAAIFMGYLAYEGLKLAKK